MDERVRSEKRRWRDTDRFSLSIQMIGLVVILLAVSTVLIRVYSKSVQESLRAEALNKGIVLSHNAAELYRENADLQDVAEAFGAEVTGDAVTVPFNRDLKPAGLGEEEWLILEVKEEKRGSLSSCSILVTKQDEEVYDLEVTVFTPEGGAADGN